LAVHRGHQGRTNQFPILQEERPISTRAAEELSVRYRLPGERCHDTRNNPDARKAPPKLRYCPAVSRWFERSNDGIMSYGNHLPDFQNVQQRSRGKGCDMTPSDLSRPLTPKTTILAVTP
jgi:hypothetical protein